MEEPAIRVTEVSKTFKLPHEKHSSLKSLAINAFGRKRYTRQKALKDVSFEVKKGEFFGIVGRNGSGKSTLLKLLAGIYVPDKGEINVNGSLTPFIELGVGFNPELTGRENVFLNGALLGFNRRQMEAMYDDIVAFAELRRFMDQKLKNYSSGMQVRLAFSIAIRAQSDILLLDEVLAVGDVAFQQKCYNYFEKLKLQHKTVVFVSHDMNAVRRFCNEAIYIEKGRLKQIGNAQEIADKYIEKNIADAEELSKARVPSKSNKISTRLSKQSANSISLSMTYSSLDKDQVYVGISVVKDGISVAEINTAELKLSRRGKVNYLLDTTRLNGGIYELRAALFRAKNRELLAVTNPMQFVIKGSDKVRGGALKLDDQWSVDAK